MQNITVFIAFIAGVFSFLSPCVLPLIPAYINILVSNEGVENSNNKLKKSLLFILGFTIVFIIMGASATFIGTFFRENIVLFRVCSGIIIIIFGLHTIEFIKISSLYREKRALHKVKGLGPIIMGMAFAAGWTPCIGPILASILLYASTTSGMFSGVILLSFYSLGLGVPFLITSIFLDKFNRLKQRFYIKMNLIKKITGMLMIIVGILMVTNKLTMLIGFLS